MPEEGKTITFNNFPNSARAPFVVYADFEALVQEYDNLERNACQATIQYQRHIACSVGFKIKSSFPQFDEPYHYFHGPNCVRKFIKYMLKFEERAIKHYFNIKPMEMTAQDERDFERAVLCHICHKPFEYAIENGYLNKGRDHDHLSGYFRGAAHARCNIRMRQTVKIPIFFHNFRGYDAHHIVTGLKQFPRGKVKVIGQAMEKYLTLSLGKYLVFKDSAMFLNTSIETLGKNLKACKEEKKFKLIRDEFPNMTDEQFNLLLGKQV